MALKMIRRHRPLGRILLAGERDLSPKHAAAVCELLDPVLSSKPRFAPLPLAFVVIVRAIATDSFEVCGIRIRRRIQVDQRVVY